jgi:hypothetical protein
MLAHQTLPSCVGSWMFCPKDVVHAQFDPSVVEVEEDAFVNCENLTELILNDGLQKIGEYAFACCFSLNTSRFPLQLLKLAIVHFSNARI